MHSKYLFDCPLIEKNKHPFWTSSVLYKYLNSTNITLSIHAKFHVSRPFRLAMIATCHYCHGHTHIHTCTNTDTYTIRHTQSLTPLRSDQNYLFWTSNDLYKTLTLNDIALIIPGYHMSMHTTFHISRPSSLGIIEICHYIFELCQMHKQGIS